jgi:hypothetical protein
MSARSQTGNGRPNLLLACALAVCGTAVLAQYAPSTPPKPVFGIQNFDKLKVDPSKQDPGRLQVRELLNETDAKEILKSPHFINLIPKSALGLETMLLKPADEREIATALKRLAAVKAKPNRRITDILIAQLDLSKAIDTGLMNKAIQLEIIEPTDTPFKQPPSLSIFDNPGIPPARVATPPPKKLLAVFPHPMRGGSCTICIPNPGSPSVGSGVGPLGLPSKDSTKPSLHPGLGVEADNEEGRRPEKLDPIGFTDVVYIEFNGNACTGTLVTDRWIATAAHCVPTPTSPAPIMKSLRLYAPRQTAEAYLACVTAMIRTKRYREPCVEFDEAKILNVRSHEDYRPSTDTQRAQNDFALIEVDLPRSPYRRIARLDFESKMPQTITVAGYGLNALGDQVPRVLEVGWNSGKLWAKPGEDFYYDHNEKAQSGVCFGDSGGPIFRERRMGAYDESHQLIAVVSSGRTKVTCQDSYWVSTTRLSEPSIQNFVRKWIKTSATILALAK